MAVGPPYVIGAYTMERMERRAGLTFDGRENDKSGCDVCPSAEGLMSSNGGALGYQATASLSMVQPTGTAHRACAEWLACAERRTATGHWPENARSTERFLRRRARSGT